MKNALTKEADLRFGGRTDARGDVGAGRRGYAPPDIPPPEGEKNSAEVNAQLEAAWGEGIIVRLFAPRPPEGTSSA